MARRFPTLLILAAVATSSAQCKVMKQREPGQGQPAGTSHGKASREGPRWL